MLVLLAAALLSGCGHFRRVRDCRRLAKHVNRSLDEIAAVHGAGGATAATYRVVADRYEKLGRDVEAFGSGDDNFGRAVQEYSAFFGETARVLRALGDGLEKPDAGAVLRARRDLTGLLRRDKGLAQRIDGACAEL